MSGFEFFIIVIERSDENINSFEYCEGWDVGYVNKKGSESIYG